MTGINSAMKTCLLVYTVLGMAKSLAIHEADYHPIEQLMGHKQTPLSRSREPKKLIGDRPTLEKEKDPEYWNSLAHEGLMQRLDEETDLKVAKNIVFFLGDGMSVSTVTAARIYQGQLKGKTGEEGLLSFEKFPYTGFSKTYCANAQVADSACTSTAYLCGVKANIVTLGVTAKVQYNNCSMSMDPENHVSSIAAWAQAAGKSTGFVTTTTLTHASPSGMYAHVANRFWECDADIQDWGDHNDPATCTDIAQQLITQAPGRYLDVMMGGGMGKFLPNSVRDAHNKRGERKDGRNLLETWKKMNPTGKWVTNRKELLNLDYKQTDKIVGTFASGVMNFHASSHPKKEPTLSEMTEAAIKCLSKNENGFVLFSEGGLIDYANHLNRPGTAADEVLELHKAVELVLKMTNPNETLIVVTADHGHTLTMSGYSPRGAPILGLNKESLDRNGIPYAILNYAIGLEQYLDKHGQRYDLRGKIGKIADTHPSQIRNRVGVHSGEDVVVYASGPQAKLFSGVMQQNTIPFLMAYSACFGDGPTLCKDYP